MRGAAPRTEKFKLNERLLSGFLVIALNVWDGRKAAIQIDLANVRNWSNKKFNPGSLNKPFWEPLKASQQRGWPDASRAS